MVILWNHTIVNVHSFVRKSQEISATIEVISTQKSWLFTSIYASPNITLRSKVWENLIEQHASYIEPWLVGGDFNDILSQNEKIGGRLINTKSSKILWNSINGCNLID